LKIPQKRFFEEFVILECINYTLKFVQVWRIKMRIFVCSKQDIITKGSQVEDFFNDDKFFITIKSTIETDWGVDVYDPIRVLQLTFDDVSDIEHIHEDDRDEITLFNKKHARKIKQFVESLNPKKTLFINCGAGISRSGAVGYVINEYLNKFLINNQNDYDFFFKVNKQVLPNPLVKSLLMKEFFGEFDDTCFGSEETAE
jgi:predicted protein tyrosine phosphatase